MTLVLYVWGGRGTEEEETEGELGAFWHPRTWVAAPSAFNRCSSGVQFSRCHSVPRQKLKVTAFHELYVGNNVCNEPERQREIVVRQSSLIGWVSWGSGSARACSPCCPSRLPSSSSDLFRVTESCPAYRMLLNAATSLRNKSPSYTCDPSTIACASRLRDKFT